MADEEDVEVIESWIEEAPHRPTCAAIIADAEVACGCGKKDAMDALDTIANSIGCDGESCEAATVKDSIVNQIMALIDGKDYAQLNRDQVKMKLLGIVDP